MEELEFYGCQVVPAARVPKTPVFKGDSTLSVYHCKVINFNCFPRNKQFFIASL